tara:strand:+ start:201 stop:491 length:291 start_codon:yes stop_codon:yes gene_type:complete
MTANWNAAQWSETKRVSYAHLTDVSYPLKARALYEALGEGLGTGAIPDDGEIVVNRRADYSAGDDVPHENLVLRLEILSEQVDTMPSLISAWEVRS